MFKFKNAAAIFLVFCSLCQVTLAADLVVQNGQAQFVAIGKPAMLKIHGETKAVQGKLVLTGNQVSGNFKLELKNLTTGIDLRDEHMKNKYLQVEKFPQAEFTLQALTLPAKLNEIQKKTAEEKFNGQLTIHGVTKPVEGVYSLEPLEKKLQAHGTFRIKISDFNIDIPTYAGLKVADVVDVEISFELPK